MATKKKATKKATKKAPKKTAKKAKKTAKKTKKPAKKKGKKGSKEILVVGSKVKEAVKAHDMRADGQLIEAVSAKVHDLLENGVMRAQENKRKTVTPHDL